MSDAEDFISLEPFPSSPPRREDKINARVITHDEISQVRKSASRGRLKFAHIKSNPRKLHVAAATIDHIEVELVYVKDKAERAEVRYTNKLHDFADEIRRLQRQVEYHKNIADEYKETCENAKYGRENAIANYDILRQTYDRLRAAHPLPAERTFPRRPKRPSDSEVDGAAAASTKKPKPE